MLGWFNEKAVKEILNIPKSKTIGLLVSVGYPYYKRLPVKNRKSFDEIVSYNKI